jgi:putative transport protein
MEEINLFSRLLDILQAQPVLTLFLIIGMGYLIGGIRIGVFPWGLSPVFFLPGYFLGILIFEWMPGPRQSVLRYSFSLLGTRQDRGFLMS